MLGKAAVACFSVRGFAAAAGVAEMEWSLGRFGGRRLDKRGLCCSSAWLRAHRLPAPATIPDVMPEEARYTRAF